ncbi:MAG: ABC transporter permease [Eubacteriales bacterium]|nr:ABC transporter permease [Eubacteriales bacterium]
MNKEKKVLTPAAERRKEFGKAFFERKTVRAGFAIILIMVFSAIFAPLVAPYDPNQQDLLNMLKGPSLAHIFGTDALGRDLLSRIIYGARASLSVGLVSTLIAGSIGITLGLTAGYLGKWVDAVIMRIMDAMMSIPVIILALFLGSILGKGLGNIMLCIGIVMMPGYARMTRGQVLAVKQLDYVTAGKIGGATRAKNALKHILPNCIAPNLVLATMNLGTAIMVEAGLSYLGMGINPPTASWGSMVSDGYRYLSNQPHIAIIPGIFIILTVWSFNVCGDALRDATDPRLRGTR